MLKVVFHHPPNVDNPFDNFNPQNGYYPDKKGVYIYGLRLVIGNNKKFVPIYVGIAYDGTLKTRLKDHHYKKNCTGGAGEKELWDFCSITSIEEIHKTYSEMYIYDYINDPQKKTRTSEAYLKILVYLKKLLFFKNRNYFNLKNNLSFVALLTEETRELNHSDAITDYPKIANEIIGIKSIFTNDFYYVYASFDEIETQINQNENKKQFTKFQSPKDKLQCIEYATKKALNILGIHTTARVESRAEILDMDIDFSEIKEELVNMGGHPYNYNKEYTDKLLINIRK
jgi:hypothetical protein